MKRGKAVPSRSPLAEAFDVIPAEAEIDHFHPSADLGFCPSVARSAFSKIRPIFLFAYSWVLLRSSRDRLSVRTLPQLGVSHDVQARRSRNRPFSSQCGPRFLPVCRKVCVFQDPPYLPFRILLGSTQIFKGSAICSHPAAARRQS